MFVLLRDRVNFHRFVGPSENPQECLQIRTEFSKPLTRAFPVMLLVRCVVVTRPEQEMPLRISREKISD